MRCYCYETDSEFFFCVEGVENTQIEDAIQHMAWVKTDGKFVRAYPQSAFSNQDEKQLISDNYVRLGQAFFESSFVGFDWEKPLKLVAQQFSTNGIEWYIVGSVGDAVRGVDVKPFDIDIVVHTRNFNIAKDICFSAFPDSIIAPFDTQGTLFLQCFGRMFLAGVMVEIVADERWNLDYRQSENKNSVWRDNGYTQPEYIKTVWRGYDLHLETMQHRYETEMKRNRTDKIKAIEEYLNPSE
ncbi:MAG: hypothetical protein FWD48_12535 [Oscillospiraceae bacterium]|nr:hypothetical protein [Oscillospiraceae bacterium]